MGVVHRAMSAERAANKQRAPTEATRVLPPASITGCIAQLLYNAQRSLLTNLRQVQPFLVQDVVVHSREPLSDLVAVVAGVVRECLDESQFAVEGT